MRKQTHHIKKSGILTRIVTLVLLVTLLLETLSFGVMAAADVEDNISGGTSADQNSASSWGSFDSEAITEALRADLINHIKDDLLMRVEDYELTGNVGIILSFSEKSLVSEYSEKYADKMTYDEFKESKEAKELEALLIKKREGALQTLEKEGLVFEIKHTYTHLLDGAYVETTYEDLEAIAQVDGIVGMMVSNSYLPMEAVDNPVDVYETGIFNSGSVEYTGKGTIVAVLDTGCDYAHSAFTTHTVADPRYSRDDIARLLAQHDFKSEGFSPNLEAREVYYGNITGGKIAFGYDYADKDPDIMPFSESHGTHVAGIIAGKDDTITGVAIDAQLAIMKVFSDYDEGAKDGDIIAALEDCILLGVDAINMSLGTSCGFSSESAADELYKNVIYSNIEKAGIALIVAASNDHSSGYGGEDGNTNKTDNPDSATVGSPSSYPASFTVASVSGKKENYMYANGKDIVFFIQSFSTSAEEYDFFEMMGIKPGDKKTYEYVAVPGFGLAINYAGLDVEGKIALVKRGDITFEEKVQFAQEAGAIAVIIYNNVYGDITMTIGNHAKIPAVSIGKDDGEMLAERKTGTFEFDLSNVAGPFMSDFSSWGPTPDLKLKPEITAHGGSIKSSVVGGEYDELSGTSMAAPNMCGIAVLIRQYVNEKYPDLTPAEARDLVNRLCMSTATIALDKHGKPYSPRKQGAGLADITKATTTAAYLLVEGIGKTKLELGDDPHRTGVYEMELQLVNLSDDAQSYRLGNITMTESVSTSDPEYVAEIAYLLSNTAEYAVEGGEIKDGVVTVAANSTATVKVKLILSDEDKSYIDSTFENGMYVEGFITFDNLDEEGVDLNAPFLAFYGNWGDAPIFDLDFYEVETEAHDSAIDDDDKIKADFYATTPLGSYYYDYILPLGCYLYDMDEDEYTPIPATRERAAVSYYKSSISGIYGVFTGFLRGAKELNISIVNTDTGEEVWTMTEYNCGKARFYGAPRGYMSKFDLAMADDKTVFGDNNTHYEVTMSAKLDWNGGENVSDTYSFSFYIDYEAPTVLSHSYRTEYDKSREENRYYLDVMIYDNHYAMSCRPVIIYDYIDQSSDYDDITKTFSSLSEYPIPIYQQNKGETTKVSIEITDYIDIIKHADTANGITLFVDDYALNSNVYYIPFPDTDGEDMDFKQSSLDLDINETFDLYTLLVDGEGNPLETLDYLKTLKWESSDESVVAVKDGRIEALKSGTATVKVASDVWLDYVYKGLDKDERPEYDIEQKYKTIQINVSETVKDDDPNAGKNANIEDLFFASYTTLKAFNNHISPSEIGRENTTNYFDGSYSIAFYPSEQVKLHYELQPWNLSEDRYTLTWKSSNEKVATVDENGVVTAMAEGKARITLNIAIDGKTSLIAARLSVEVKSEFIIENRELVAYKGWGGDVVIPDDEGILYIGSYAFSHFTLDNKKEVEKDEHGYYDLDDKKTPIGNHTVTSVVIPKGVENIKKHAFYNCSKLTKVVLPDDCETIGASAFQNCRKLVDVNFEGVKIISNYAFKNCVMLSCDGIGGMSSESLYAVGEEAFMNTAITTLNLPKLSRISKSAFENCKDLTEVILGPRTRVSNSMFKGCSNLRSITVYSDTVDDNAFANCTGLEVLTLEGDVTYLGSNALSGCSALTDVNIKGQLEKIGDGAFGSCVKLTELTLPNGPITIGNNVFQKCQAFTKLIFRENTKLDYVGVGSVPATLTFDVSSSALYSLDTASGIIYTKSGDTLVFVLPTSAATEITVPATVKYIASGAFVAAHNVETLNFAAGSQLESIGYAAFAGNNGITTVNLPANEITIGAYAFDTATNLKTIDLSKVTEIGELAFRKVALTSANLTKEGVKIGANAFNYAADLTSVVLGANAVIGENAFNHSGVVTVDLMGDATIGTRAFSYCKSLKSFDFADVTVIGVNAFRECSALTEIVAPKLVTVNDHAFVNCTSLKTLKADELKTIGKGAFFDTSTDITKLPNSYLATKLTEISLPKLEKVGEYAFTFSAMITAADLPMLKDIGKMSFGMNGSLQSITFSDELTVIPEQAFFGCTSLQNFNFSNIEYIGTQAFYFARIPSDLVLENVVELADRAFVENGLNLLKTLKAPKLTTIGAETFFGCVNMTKIEAPMLESIGGYAFAATGFVEFEVGANLKNLEDNAFFSCEEFEAFYFVENGERLNDKVLEHVMIKDGVLYSKNARGYSLYCYPAAKTDMEFVVAEGTTRIEFYAGSTNTHLRRLVLPSTLRTIADFAFYGCENLDTVTFKSYYAPTLEGRMSIATTESLFITVENVDKYPGFNDLYKYSYQYIFEGWTGRNLYHNNFKGSIGGESAPKMTAILPDKCEGYDSLSYVGYFNVDGEQTSGIGAGKYAIAFTDAVHNLPENVDRFDRLLVEAAINAYNALQVHEDDKIFVDAAIVEKFERIRSAYNVDVVDGMIAHLFGMYNNEYSFNILKEATLAYSALSEEEQAMVASAEILDQKKTELVAAMGTDVNFELEYKDHFAQAEEDEPTEEPPADTADSGWIVTVIIIAASVLAAAIAAVAVVLIIKKKKTVKPNPAAEVQKSAENEVSSEENGAEAATNTAEAEENPDEKEN